MELDALVVEEHKEPLVKVTFDPRVMTSEGVNEEVCCDEEVIQTQASSKIFGLNS